MNRFRLYCLFLLILVPGILCRPHGVRHESSAKKKLRECEATLRELQGMSVITKGNTSEFLRLDEMMLAVEPGNELHEPRYTLLINEINLDNPGPNSKVYIELEAIRRPVEGNPNTPDLQGFILLVIRGRPLEIVMSVRIGALVRKVVKKFIVLGTKAVNADVDLKSSDVESIYTGTDTLPGGDDSPYGIVILYSALQSVLDDVTLENEGNNYQPIDLAADERLQEIVEYNLVDLVVVGRKTMSNHCNFFERLKPTALVNPDSKTLLRDWDSASADGSTDLSLSRCCGDKRPNDQDCFRLSTPSVGAENTCNFRRPFYLEKVIAKQASLEVPMETDSDEIQECPADYPEIPSSRYGLINDHTYAAALQEELNSIMQCPGSQRGNDQNTVVEAQGADEDMEVDEDGPPAMIPVFKFNTAGFEQCKQYLTKPDEINVPAVTAWLEVIREVGKCKFRCFACSVFLQKGFRPDIKHPTKITKSGYYSSNKSRNKAQILDHINPQNSESFALHQQAFAYVSALKMAKSPQDVKAAEDEAHRTQKQLFAPTINAMKLSWAELRAEVPFRSHPIFFETVKDLGVNLGSYHASDHALRLYAQAFSEGFHLRLLKYLTQHKPPFSFMTDATTHKNIGFLVCLLQTLELGQPVVYFWRLIRLTKSESGSDMMADIKKSIEEDEAAVPGFKKYFEDNIIAFVSDRGSPMIGRKKGLIAQFISYVNRNVQAVSCSAHKTETAIKHALSLITNTAGTSDHSKKYFLKFGDLNNKIYSYYMSRGSKRWSHLVEIGQEMGVKTSRIKYHHSIRWSQSKKEAMETLLKDYEAIREDLDRISAGTGETSEKAQKILKIISDKSFGSTLAEFVDLLTVSERMLQDFQQKHGLLMEIGETLRDGLRRYEHLKNNIGTNLKAFLAKTTCMGECDIGECTLQQCDACEIAYYRNSVATSEGTTEDDQDSSNSNEESDGGDEVGAGSAEPYTYHKLVPLENHDENSVPLSLWRSRLYDQIVLELKRLFDTKQLESFDVVNPQYFVFSCPVPGSHSVCENINTCYKPFIPIHSIDTPDTALEKWKKVCKFYTVSTGICTLRLGDWKTLLAGVVTSEKYQVLAKDFFLSQFWSHALSDSALPWTEGLKDLVRKILVTGQSSASAERAFSILSRLKSSERSSLAEDTLDDLIRIRFNGPEKIDDHSMYEYTIQFLRKRKRVDQREGGSEHWKRKRNEDGTKGVYRSRLFS